MDFQYIIVQAGGKGTRMQHLTHNKPKALVPVNNLPIIFHLFRKYPDKKFIIIGDYKCDVLEKYLAAFAEVDYKVVNASRYTGTCAGLKLALEKIPASEPFMLIWSDLILPEEFSVDGVAVSNYVGTSLGFECRWKYENGIFSEERSSSCGVAGLFLFRNKDVLQEVPADGEFVKWLSGQNMQFDTVTLERTKEYGLLSEYDKLPKAKCRPFNRITMSDEYIIKEGIDEQGRQLAVRERAWYEKVQSLGFANLPQIYETEPLKLERINGKNVYEYEDLATEQKQDILKQIVDCLQNLHACGSAAYDNLSFEEAYISKTFDRLAKVRNLVPFANDEYITINGCKCRNIFFVQDELQRRLDELKPQKFVFLHGDCTFSNIMLRNDMEPVLIDPRGYFGRTEFYGDAAYDWVKLYYSVVGNYDQFNLKRFSLGINEHDVRLYIQSSGWEDIEDYFFELLGGEVKREQIKLLHAIIWLSLTTYAWEDYDSICGAFYNGIKYLEEAL